MINQYNYGVIVRGFAQPFNACPFIPRGNLRITFINHLYRVLMRFLTPSTIRSHYRLLYTHWSLYGMSHNVYACSLAWINALAIIVFYTFLWTLSVLYFVTCNIFFIFLFSWYVVLWYFYVHMNKSWKVIVSECNKIILMIEVYMSYEIARSRLTSLFWPHVHKFVPFLILAW